MGLPLGRQASFDKLRTSGSSELALPPLSLSLSKADPQRYGFHSYWLSGPS